MTALMSYDEVGRRLGMSPDAVRMTELRALHKLRRHPILQQIAADCGLKKPPRREESHQPCPQN